MAFKFSRGGSIGADNSPGSARDLGSVLPVLHRLHISGSLECTTAYPRRLLNPKPYEPGFVFLFLMSVFSVPCKYRRVHIIGVISEILARSTYLISPPKPFEGPNP